MAKMGQAGRVQRRRPGLYESDSFMTQARVPFVYQIEGAKQQKRFRDEQKAKDAAALAKQKEQERLADIEKQEADELAEDQARQQTGGSALKYGLNMFGDESTTTFGDVGKKIGSGWNTMTDKVGDWFGGGDSAFDYSGVGAGEGFIEGMNYGEGWSSSTPTGSTFGAEEFTPGPGGMTPDSGGETGLFSGIGSKVGDFFGGLDVGNAFAGGLAGFGASQMFGDKSEKTKGLIGAGSGALLNIVSGGGITGALSGGLFGGLGGLLG
jgi:hypothetical protein